MKAVAVNGSARGAKGVTGKLLAAFTAGLERGGAQVTVVNLKELTIAPCVACLSCFHKTPGKCAQSDDMDKIYPLLKKSDLFVMATPVYTDSMTAQMKAMCDRCIPAMQPFLTPNPAGLTTHPAQWNMPARTVLLSTCGFPEPAHFAPLKATVRAQAKNFHGRVIGEFCVPGSIALQMDQTRLDNHLALLRQAGEQMAAQGKVNPALAADINRPPLSTDQYLELAAKYEAWCSKNRQE